MKKFGVYTALFVLGVLSFLAFEASYPAAYSELKGGMTEEQAKSILRDDHFVFHKEFLNQENVWVRKQVVGEWIISCGFDAKDKLWSVSYRYHVQGFGQYLRARGSSF